MFGALYAARATATWARVRTLVLLRGALCLAGGHSFPLAEAKSEWLQMGDEFQRAPDPMRVQEWRAKIDIIQKDVTHLAWSREIYKSLRRDGPQKLSKVH